MGMLDTLMGQLMGSRDAGNVGMGGLGSLPGMGGGEIQNPLLQLGLRLLQQNGGIEGLLAKLHGAGLGEHADSWVGTGQNLPVDPGALSNALGSNELGQLAKQSGLAPGAIAGGLAAILPQLIDHLTPNGRVETGADDEVSKALAALKQQRAP